MSFQIINNIWIIFMIVFIIILIIIIWGGVTNWKFIDKNKWIDTNRLSLWFFNKKNSENEIAQLNTDDIISFGLPRSGTTVLWNLLRECLPQKKVVKTHWYFNSMNKFLTIGIKRDIRDCILSYYIATFTNAKTTKMRLKDFKLFEHIVDKGIKNYKLFLGHPNIYFIKYEDFVNNFNVLFNLLETIFKKKISDTERNFLINKYSKENIKKYLQNKKISNTFLQSDKITRFAGNHIYKGEVGGYLTHMEKELLEYLNKKYEKLLLQMGY